MMRLSQDYASYNVAWTITGPALSLLGPTLSLLGPACTLFVGALYRHMYPAPVLPMPVHLADGHTAPKSAVLAKSSRITGISNIKWPI